ncbi:hypothetical protein [Salipaludibacillus sp. CF4.18]|uniref:hypothetical protein n=1 Tax=Salipaludibacillus sp. CF4.18 TaxID=3373081 RepID=UPI003EE43B26
MNIRILGVICYVTAILYLTNHFFHVLWIENLFSLLGAVLLANAIFLISPINRFVVSILIIVGSIIFYLENVHFITVLHGFGENINLLSLFILIPLIGTFMSTVGYLSTIKEKVQLKEKQGGKHPYRLSYLLVTFTGTLLNFGAMAIVKKIADESFSSFQEKKLTLHILRGFGFCVLWSPYFVNVGLVLVLLDVSWFSIGGYGFVLAMVYAVISIIMLPAIQFADDPILVEDENKRSLDSDNNPSLLPVLSFSGVLLALSFLLEYFVEINMLTVVSILALILPVIWAIGSKVLRTYLNDVSVQVQASFFKLKNELAIFISAGYFGVAVSYTNMGEIISTFLLNISFGFVYLFTIFIIMIAVLLAQIGIHPIIIVIGIGGSLSPETFGITSEYLALTLLLAWTTATQLSPFSGQVLMASKLMNTSTPKIAKANAPFVLIIFVVLSCLLYSFHAFGWV